jgi:fructose-bisphosphate aldolase class I
LDGLRERFAEYAKLGAAFSKWRAVITIGEGIPTDFCLLANAHALARYAALSQEAGIVPIVEPEVLMDGDHTLARCEEVTAKTLQVVFEQLAAHQVKISGMILKPNMVVSGSGLTLTPMATPQEVAEATVSCFKANLPADLPGAVFLSGGLSPDEATQRLLAINNQPDLPWELSYSFGRALQAEALETWAGKEENGEAMQEAFLVRAKKVSMARQGQ